MLKKLKNAFLAITAFSCFALTFIACPQPQQTGEGTEASLSLSESSITLKTVGETKTISATYSGSDKLSWTVEDTSIATVEVANDTLSATVKAVKAGSTNLSVKEANGSLSASVKITNSISADPVSDLKITSSDASSITISWTAPANYENFTVKSFSVSDSEETEIKSQTVSNATYTLSELSANTKYKFYVYTNYGGVQSVAQSIEAQTSSVSIALSLEGDDFSSPTQANATITLIATVTDSSGETKNLSITEWISSDETIATVKADDSDSNKATVTAVGPSGTVNITAKIKDGDAELASKSYECTIVGKAVDVSNVAVQVQSSVADSELSDKQVKVSWDKPSYFDSFKVELYKVDSENGTIAENATVSKSQDAITDSSVTLEVSDYGYYVAKVYSVYGEDVSSGVSSSSVQVKDFLPCGDVSKVKLDLSAASPSLTWEDPSDSDLASIKIYVDSSDAIKIAAKTQKYENSSLSSASSIKITTVDTSENESSGFTITVGDKPSLSETSTTSTGYTGQLVVSGLELTSGVTYSVEYAGDVENAVAILDADNAKVYVNGLTVGSAETPKFTLTATYDNYSVVYATLSAKEATPTMTVWKLKSWWPTDLPPAIVPHISSSVTVGNIVMANFAGASQTSDMMYADASYTAFIVYPGLTNTDGTSISLEATDSKGTSSGLYVYADIKGDVSWQSSYSNKTNWSYGYSSKPQLYTVSKNEMTDTQKSEAVFYKVSSSSGASNNVPNGYEGWFNIKSAVNNAYWYGSCFNVSLNSEIASNGDSDVAILSQTWSGSESSDKPTEITDFSSSVEDHSITLTWTDPSDVDFSYLEISSTDTLLDGTTAIETQKISAGTQSATFTKLSAATNYSFTVTEYDVFGNSTQTSTSAQTAQDSTAPSAISGLKASSGRNNVTLSWTTPSDVDAKNVKIYQGDSTTAVKEVSVDNVSSTAENTNSADIKELTAGTEYTFKVTVVDYAGNESDGVEISATPTTPAPSEVSVEAKYTGSILVTWKDTTASETDDSGNAISYSYKVTLTGSSTKEMIVESGVEQVHFTGLTIGDTYTGAKVQCIPSDDESAGETVTVTKDITVSKVLWKIACDEYDNSNRLYRVLPAIYTGSTYTTSNHIIVEFDGTESGSSTNAEWQYLTYGVWEVVPALADSSDGSKFSLMASTADGVETGLYFYGDKNRSIASGTYYSNHWGSNANLSATNSYPVLFFVAPAESGGEYIDTDNSDDLASATFSLSEASTSVTTLMSNNSYGNKMYYIYTTMNNTDYYWADIHTLCEGTTNSSLKTSFAICETTLTEDTLAGAPGEVSNLSYDSDSLSATNVTLTWTNPTEADFDHVLISWGLGDDESVISTGTSATISGLSSSTSYNFTVKTVDMMGNTSDGVSVSVTTSSGTNYPTDATATVGYTGQLVLTWTDANIYNDYTYTVSATSSGSDTVEDQTIAQGTQKAVFNGLTVGNTYTFTLKATHESIDYEYSDSTLSAQAVKVLWHLVGGYGDRVMMCNILNNDENSCTTGYNVIAEDPNQSSGTSGNCSVVSFSTLSYPYWLVMPSLNDSSDAEHFSLMASDSIGTESGYYLYSDSSRDVSSSSNLSHWWTSIDTVNSWTPKLFVAKTDESYITDNKMASFSKIDSSYTDSSSNKWVNFVCEYNNYYVQHANLIYKLVSSISEENCAALTIQETTLTE